MNIGMKKEVAQPMASFETSGQSYQGSKELMLSKKISQLELENKELNNKLSK